MDNIIKKTLENKFKEENFLEFSNEFFNGLDFNEKQKLSVPSKFSKYIEEFHHLSEFKESSNSRNTIDILVVKLKSASKVERARASQRNIVAKHLKNYNTPAAFVAFYSDDNPEWRLSFVEIDKKFDEKGKVQTDVTPAKRYSFLVGEGLPLHTPEKQLKPLIQDDKKELTTERIKEAFSVEPVTKEFFNKYKELYKSLHKDLKENHTFQNEADKYNLDNRNFAKKLLGQIVFLYFIQKKGWLGVPKNKSWGEGDKKFLRTIFNESQKKDKNFFNDYLEPLFYNTLNNSNRGTADQSYSKLFNSRIPFLNGGLFEPEYDWEGSNIYLGDKIFEEIFDVFDQYNFTIKEDEPLDKEVAVDPEMLGKVFENLLEENIKKSKGTYYTPRTIVHYMCKESLINYLHTETEIPENELRKLLNLSHALLGGEVEGIKNIKKNKAKKIDKALKEIKVVDPACGSGAFLVGMLKEIITLRAVTGRVSGNIEDSVGDYELKKEAIQNSIYGVDIDSGAIDVAKLRLWLSLVVDHDMDEIEPLPNLQYKVMQGNSLLETFKGITLYKEDEDKGKLFKNEERQKKIKELKEKKRKFYGSSDDKNKKELKEEINNLIDWFIKDSLSREKERISKKKKKVEEESKQLTNSKDKKKLYKNLTNALSKEEEIDVLLEKIHDPKAELPFFLWKLSFMEVFDEKNGFDVVIGNPPYINIYEINKKDKDQFYKIYSSAKYKFDIYVLFMEKAINLLNDGGISCLITSNKWLSQKYGEMIRNLYLSYNLIEIINFNFNIFDAMVNTCITTLQKNNPTNKCLIGNFKEDHQQKNTLKELLHNKKLHSQIKIEIFKLVPNNKFRLNLNEKKLELIKKIRKKSKKIEDFCYVAYGVRPNSPSINKGKDYFIENKNTNKDLKKYFEGKDIQKWNFSSERFLNYRPDLHYNSMFPELFENEKLVSNEIIGKNGFKVAIDRKFRYNNNTVINLVKYDLLKNVEYKPLKRIITNEKINNSTQISYNFLIALLNSKLLYYYFEEFLSIKLHFYPNFVKNLPVKQTPKEKQKPLIKLVNKILEIAESNDYLDNEDKQRKVKKLEKEIDELIYDLYDLTDEEIKIVENYDH